MIDFTVESKAIERMLDGLPNKVRSKVGNKLRTVTGPAVDEKFRLFAPEKTGRFKNSGTVQVDRTDMNIQFVAGKGIRGMRTGFPYPRWLAGEIPTINTRSPANLYFAPGQTIEYGKGGSTPSGAPVKWSSTPRWWQGVRSFANRKAPQDVRVAIQEALKRG